VVHSAANDFKVAGFGSEGPGAETGAAGRSFSFLLRLRRRSSKIERILPLSVCTPARSSDLRSLSNLESVHAAFALGLNKFSIKMPCRMAQYWQDHGKADQKQDCPGGQQHDNDQAPDCHH